MGLPAESPPSPVRPPGAAGCGVLGGCGDADFTRALGSGLSDKCLEAPGGSPGPGCSRTAQQLRRLFPALALALRCLRLLPPRPHAPPGGLCPRLQVLGRCLAAVAAAHAWLTGRAGRYLAAWALPQFLLLTQGDLC
uniref:coiled-coil domain-containing protein 142 n=1 Tax=Lonchura striata TaxID=40157 RepID=UPI00129416C3|nr:coiled-coil domain-containing protein 142 [Lonchura striata domestica]